MSSSKLRLADGLSKLIPKNSEPLEDMVIASLQVEVEMKKYNAKLGGTTCDFGRNKEWSAEWQFYCRNEEKPKRQE